MKILRISSLGYVGGGVETGIQLLQPELTARGHDVRILTSDHGPDSEHYSHYEFPAVSNHSGLKKLLYRVFHPGAYKKLREVLAEFEPDIVQIHSMFEVSASVLFALRKYPTVLTVHGAEDYTKGLLLWAFPLDFFKHPDDFTKKNLNLKGWIHYLYHLFVSMPVYNLGFRYVNQFVVFSEYMQNMMADQGVQSVVIPNFTSLYEPFPIDNTQKHMLYVGRLEKIKGVHDAIMALSMIRDKHPEAHLTIAGRGEYEEDLRKLVKQKGMEEVVHFRGHINREQLYELYKECTVLVVPSVWPEPFGKIGAEAYSVGRPVIAADVGGISSWLRDGETGYLIPSDNQPALAEALTKYFDDPEEIQRMSERALVRAQDFTIEKHADRILKVYEKTIETFRED